MNRKKKMDNIITRDDKLRFILTKLEQNLKRLKSGHHQFIRHQFQMGMRKMMLKFASQNLPSKSSTGLPEIGQAFETSMTLLFTKNKILVTLISLRISNHICVIQQIL